MNDDSIMPFGKYRGQKMANVPVNYLHWLWNNCKVGDDNLKDVRNYIYENLHVLKEENDDLIWDRP